MATAELISQLTINSIMEPGKQKEGRREGRITKLQKEQARMKD